MENHDPILALRAKAEKNLTDISRSHGFKPKKLVLKNFKGSWLLRVANDDRNPRPAGEFQGGGVGETAIGGQDDLRQDSLQPFPAGVVQGQYSWLRYFIGSRDCTLV